jgi:predicted lactoylglutathione lyase
MSASKIRYITICCNDLVQTKNFYHEFLNWTPWKLSSEYLFYTVGSEVLVFWEKSVMQKELGIQLEDFKNTLLSINLSSRQAVDALYEKAISLNVEILKPIADTSMGYHFFWRDRESNLWEIVFNPNCFVE